MSQVESSIEMSARSRRGLIVLFFASVALAAYAQHLFAERDSAWYYSVILYVVAVLLFLWIAQQVDVRGTPRSGESPGHSAQITIPVPSKRVALVAVGLAASLLAGWDSNRPEHPEPYAFAIGMWLLGIGLFAAAFFPWSQLRRERWREGLITLRPALAEILFVAVLVLFAFVLRAFDVEHIPLNFGGDEGEMGLQARAFLTGQFPNPFGTSTFFGHQSMWFFLQSLSLSVFGDSVFGLRMLSVVVGTLTVLTTYLLVREMFGVGLAMVTSLLLAVYSFHIHFSRVALSSIADPFWTTLVFLLVIRGLASRRIGYFVAAGVALGYSQYFYLGMRLLLITLSIFLMYWFVKDRHAIVSHLGNLVAMGAASVLTAVPLILYYLNRPSLFFEHYNAMGIFPSGWVGRIMQQTGESAIAIVLDRIRRSFLFYNAIPDSSGFYGPGTPLLEAISAVLFVFGLAYSIYRLRDRSYFLFVMWFALAVFFGAVMVIDENGSERLVTASVPVIFFVALGLLKLAEVGARLFASTPRLRRQLVVLGLVLIAFINIKFYFVEYTPRRTYSGDGGWRLTEMARLFLAQTRPFKAYFFGAPYDYLSHGTIRYMVPALDGLDVVKPISGPPDFVDPSRRALFLFRPEREQELAFVQQAYPMGERIDYRMPNGDELFLCYEVDKPSLQVQKEIEDP